MDGFSTYDVYQAGYLVYRGLSVSVSKDGKGRAVFRFEDKTVEEKLRDYMSGDSVDILKYVGIVKNLRNQIYYVMKSGE